MSLTNKHCHAKTAGATDVPFNTVLEKPKLNHLFRRFLIQKFSMNLFTCWTHIGTTTGCIEALALFVFGCNFVVFAASLLLLLAWLQGEFLQSLSNEASSIFDTYLKVCFVPSQLSIS